MKNKYKVMAFDLDGTLTNSEKKISKKTKEELYRLRAKGIHLVLATGRPRHGIEPVIKELEMEQYGGYVVAYNGGMIIDCKSGEILYEKTIPNHLIQPICQYAANRELALMLYKDDCIYTCIHNQYTDAAAKINNMKICVVEDLEKIIKFPVNKFLITESEAVNEEIINGVKYTFSELNVFTSAPIFMEIVPKGVDKALTLEVLLNRLGCKREELIAFGDGDNDISMLKYAGLGVAMANGSEKSREAADMITLTNDEDGVRVVLEKL